jgi:hypothetical protein
MVSWGGELYFTNTSIDSIPQQAYNTPDKLIIGQGAFSPGWERRKGEAGLSPALLRNCDLDIRS